MRILHVPIFTCHDTSWVRHVKSAYELGRVYNSVVNKEQLRKNVNDRVRLRPIAHRLHASGHPLPQLDDEWRIEAVTDDGLRIFLPRTGHGRLLGFDHICEYTSDRIEWGIKYGFLTLKVQLSIQGHDVRVTPMRPGNPMPPRSQ